MTQTEQIKNNGPLNEFVNEEINSANFDGFNSKPQTGINSMTNMSIQNENPPQTLAVKKDKETQDQNGSPKQERSQSAMRPMFTG